MENQSVKSLFVGNAITKNLKNCSLETTLSVLIFISTNVEVRMPGTKVNHTILQRYENLAKMSSKKMKKSWALSFILLRKTLPGRVERKEICQQKQIHSKNNSEMCRYKSSFIRTVIMKNSEKR